MGVRETLNRSPKITAAAAVVFSIAALSIGVLAWRANSTPAAVIPGDFFTDDDGATYFEDAITRITPFEHNGRIAVRAYVYKSPGGKLFVGYLERSTGEAARILHRVREGSGRETIMTEAERGLVAAGKEFRKPGEKQWKQKSSTPEGAYLEAQRPPSPDGSGPGIYVSAEPPVP